eukprot:1159731-Pelagomonas_calceolata.AAC.9
MRTHMEFARGVLPGSFCYILSKHSTQPDKSALTRCLGAPVIASDREAATLSTNGGLRKAGIRPGLQADNTQVGALGSLLGLDVQFVALGCLICCTWSLLCLLFSLLHSLESVVASRVDEAAQFAALS